MAVTVYWDEVLASCLRVDLQEPWNWREFKDAAQKAQGLLAQCPQAQAYIVDVRNAGDLPPAGFLTHSRNALQDLPILPMVFIANTPIMQIIFQPIQQLFRVKRQFYFAHTLEEARAILKHSVPET